ncbi:MAG: hypothetical protein QXU98_12385 [Candidatus Parvarchaeota archaeon]
MSDITNLKRKALHADDPIKTLILALPDEIDRMELVSKFDIILKLMEKM